MSLRALALTAAVKEQARELGFDRVACGPATIEHGAAFERWLAAGHAAGMGYMARTRADRLDPARLLPGVRSAVTLALNYRPAAEPAEGDPWRSVARYARGRDYHDVMRPRLAALATFLDGAAGAGTRSRAAVDTSAVLERDLAAAAGLGWIGRNTMLLAPELGSWFFIGIVLTTADLAPDERVPDRCGTCRACLDACPTGAFVAPYELDARRCISYLTIEHRGDIPETLRDALGPWLFGCDVCQEVCPWNRKAPATREPAFGIERDLPPPSLLLEMTEEDFRGRFRGTALYRARHAGLLRNAALVARCGTP
ncbi:MAG: tRNA epoxyqueuosine(34) reductase QueG [Candidatus Rokubacteria bacterium]|nr:tRNA epoxyqueuosine(34) reductase QueG [Candidatus Rokubacteria bacterium]